MTAEVVERERNSPKNPQPKRASWIMESSVCFKKNETHLHQSLGKEEPYFTHFFWTPVLSHYTPPNMSHIWANTYSKCVSLGSGCFQNLLALLFFSSTSSEKLRGWHTSLGDVRITVKVSATLLFIISSPSLHSEWACQVPCQVWALVSGSSS